MIDKKIDIITNEEVWVYKGYKITCPQCGSNDLLVYNYTDIFDTCEVRADCKKCNLDFSVQPVYEYKKKMSQLQLKDCFSRLKVKDCFSHWMDLKFGEEEKVYKVILLDKNDPRHSRECFKTKCTEEEIKKLVGNLNSYNDNSEEQHYVYYSMTTEGE